MQAFSPPASPSSGTHAELSLCVQTATPPASSPSPPPSPVPGLPALEPPARVAQLEDSPLLPRWGPCVVPAALGLGAAFVLNRLRPPASLRQSLIRYAITQLPAIAYIACDYALDRAIHAFLHNTFLHKTGFDPEELTPISAFRQTGEQEQARRHRLGIPGHHNLPGTYIAAWLNNSGENTDFSDAQVLAAALAASSPHCVVGLVTACRQFQWYSHPLPGSRTCHTHEPGYGTAAEAPRFNFHLLTRRLDEPGWLLPLDRLRCADVLVLMMVVSIEGDEGWMMTAIERGPGDFFMLFNPGLGLFFTAQPQRLQNAVRPEAASVRALRLEMIRLRRHASPDRGSPSHSGVTA